MGDDGSRPLETAFRLRHALRLLADPGDPIRPDKRDDFLAGITRYCAQVRAEPGNWRFTCSEDLEESNRFVVVANNADQAAGEAHVASEHAQWFFGWLSSVVSRVPSIVYQELPGAGWSEMSEVRLD